MHTTSLQAVAQSQGRAGAAGVTVADEKTDLKTIDRRYQREEGLGNPFVEDKDSPWVWGRVNNVRGVGMSAKSRIGIPRRFGVLVQLELRASRTGVGVPLQRRFEKVFGLKERD
ncbi:hypothetical protein QR680_008790 [Steinernema hermaphroditum]|uniref:Uncharacterized protein n=1 Tax=Steinernema hermaphroditum TaxID=289476 RepID=A0AA39M8B1_9BILA|nr:hypothetical protein QR680_008790 [Steinernema hermaphroditum]